MSAELKPGDEVIVTFMFSPPLRAVVVKPDGVWTDVQETLDNGHVLTHRLLTKHMTVVVPEAEA